MLRGSEARRQDGKSLRAGKSESPPEAGRTRGWHVITEMRAVDLKAEQRAPSWGDFCQRNTKVELELE